MHDYFKLADIFLEGLEEAAKLGMRSEFVADFLTNILNSSHYGSDEERVSMSVEAAFDEWDM